MLLEQFLTSVVSKDDFSLLLMHRQIPISVQQSQRNQQTPHYSLLSLLHPFLQVLLDLEYLRDDDLYLGHHWLEQLALRLDELDGHVVLRLQIRDLLR